ncbi:hypothetical protein ADIAL_0983 [Alkalibacterium sp. AK22]|nr:hypothetical protein ADIAL_0983 [Alkalibacterium sp. AK22]
MDTGNVLIPYVLSQFIQTLTPDPHQQPLLLKIIFQADEWLVNDHGTFTREELSPHAYLKLPKKKAPPQSTIS